MGKVIRFPSERIALSSRQLDELMEEAFKENEELLARLEQARLDGIRISKELAAAMDWNKWEAPSL